MKIFHLTKILSFVVAATLLVGCNTTTDGSNSGESWNSGTDRDPSAQTLYSMGRILSAQDKQSQAEFVFQHALLKDPTYMPTYVDLAQLYLSRGQGNRAIDTLDAGLKQDPKSAVLLNNRGMCMVIDGQYEGALYWFERAVEINPHEARYQSNWATALGLLGDYDKAYDTYLKVIPPADAHYNLAVLSRARNDHARSELEFKRAAAKD